MSIVSYSDLTAAVANFTERSDLDAVIPDFITLAEARINRSLRHPGMETRTTVTISTTAAEIEFATLPTDFQSIRRAYLPDVSGEPTLDYRSESQLSKYRYGIVNTPGRPRYYTIFSDQIEFAPTPDGAYDVEIVYRTKLASLNSTNTTNWLLTLAPDVYLYGALYQAAQYLNEIDKLQVWGSCYQAALDDLTLHGRHLKYGGSPIAINLAGQITP